ncbi:hypothetical protein [Amycolatopsis sp. cmx-4-68]|uniref:hypothetical protein n=1 Tax=Amycolatopsis sp. cmx-4-68 TaxID=2790938 RepID=UPI0039785FAB
MTEIHGAACAACDAARAVVAELRAEFDPLDNWDETEVGNGQTTADRAVALAAIALHRFPIPGAKRPQRSNR